jgi:hypothetical protein
VPNSPMLCLPPEPHSVRDGINSSLFPPFFFIAKTMQRPVMGYAKGNCPLVTDLASQRPWLSESEVMGMTWQPATDDTGLRGDIAEVLLVPNSPWCADQEIRLIDMAQGTIDHLSVSPTLCLPPSFSVHGNRPR